MYIDLPTGQVSWHFHDSQAHLFAHLPPYEGAWDRHDTPEKYRRLAALPNIGAQVEQYREAIEWALGTRGEFRTQGTMDGAYWWRGELAEKARLSWNGTQWIDKARKA